jgi:hypothetical protein
VVPDAWARAFVLTDLVRRSQSIGARSNEPLPAWMYRLHIGPTSQELIVGTREVHGRPRTAALMTRTATRSIGSTRS